MRSLRDRFDREPHPTRRYATSRLCLSAAAVFGAIALVTTHSAVGARDKVTRDRKPPTTPTGLSITGSTATSVSLSWSPSRDNSGVAGYKLYVNSAQVGTTSSTSYTLTGLTCGSSYTLGVSAYDGAGNTSVRATAVVSTNPCYDVLPPSPPSGLTQTAASDTSATVSWKASTDNVGVVGYGAYMGIIRVGQTGQTTTFTFTGLRCGQTTSVGLDAVDAAGNRSAQTVLSVTTGACVDTQPPSAPSGVTKTSTTESTISLSWTASSDNVGVAYYKIYSNGVAAGTTPQTSFSVSGLACATSYAVAIEAYDAAGNHSSQATATLTTSTCPRVPSAGADTQPPTVPGSLAVQSSTQTSVTLSWNSSTDNVGVAGYGAYQGAVRVGQTAQLNYTFTGLSCGTSSAFGIDAYDAAGNRSAQASVIASTSPCPDMQAPSQPIGLTLTTRTTSSLSLTWAASTDNIGVVGYGVYRAGTRVGTASSATYTVTGLACGTSYAIGVDAYDAAGNRSTQAIATMATSSCPDTQPPSTPTNLSPSGATQTSLTLSWAASSDNVGVAGYNIYANGTEVASTSGTSYTVSNLTCGTSYTLALEAFDGAGNRSPQASVGASTSACPAAVSSCNGVSIGTANDLQQAINANSAGATFCIKAGIHRMTNYVVPKSGDRFVGEPGAILSGSKEITSLFTPSGSDWVASGQTQQNPVGGVCKSGTACQYPDDVYFDHKPLQRVLSLAGVGPGKFFFDYPNDKIYIGNNPAGHTVEAAIATGAFHGWGTGASGVLIQGLIVEEFANSDYAAINARDWTIENNEVRLNHGAGIEGGSIIKGNYVHDNGMIGLQSFHTSGQAVTGNEVSYNNYAGFDPGWNAGGMKYGVVTDETFSGNYVHNNNGPGMWCDTDCLRITYSNNRVENNAGPGIDYEVSYDATITGNTVSGNGFGNGGTFQGAGILLQDSSNVDVYGNTLSGNNAGIGLTQIYRGSGAYGTFTTQNDQIHDNSITMRSGNSGLVDWDNDPSVYTSKNNHFYHNAYIGCSSTQPFVWANGSLSWSQWVANGNDTTGSFAFLC